MGASWVALPPLEPFAPPARVGPEVVALWLRHFFAALSATYPVLREHCVADRPDGICYDATNWPARVVAGTRLDAQTLTVDTLRSAVAQVTSSSEIRANLHQMRRAAHNGGGAPRGAAAIEEYLSKT